MKRTILISTAIILAFVLAGLGFVYFQAVKLVQNEVLNERERLAALDNGSVFEWSDYYVDGLHVVFEDFHYLDTRQDYEVFAENLQATGRFGGLYDLELQNAKIKIGRYDEFLIDNANLDGFNDPKSFRDFKIKSAEFDNLTWHDLGGSDATLSMEEVDIRALANLKFQSIEFHNLSGQNPVNDTALTAPNLSIDNLRLIENKSGRVNGFLYDQFSLPEIQIYWHDKPILQGSIASNGQYERDTNFLETGNFDARFEIVIDRDDIRAYSAQSKEIDNQNEQILLAFAKEDITGEIVLNASLDAGGIAKLSWKTEFDNLGSLDINALFNGYHTRIIRDLSNNADILFSNETGPLPNSFSELTLVSASFDYQDDKLADIYLDEISNIDPALASFLLQMTLPQYLPKDRELVRDAAFAITNFLRGRNQLTIEIAPETPIGIQKIVEIFANQGPYQENLALTIEGR